MTPQVGFGVTGPVLEIIDPGTGSVEDRMQLPRDATGVTVSPDGRTIALVTDGLALMYRDGSSFHYIYKPTEQHIITPDWSPDGRDIAFTDASGGAVLRRISSSGGAPVTITAQFPGTDGVWSPDGTEIVLGNVAAGSLRQHLALVSRDGASARLLTPAPPGAEMFVHQQPAWSPDGTQIAFSGWMGGGTKNIMMVSHDGSVVRQLTSDIPNASNPAWSADGTQIFFLSVRPDTTVVGHLGTDVFVVDVASGLVRQVTHTPSLLKFDLVRIAR